MPAADTAQTICFPTTNCVVPFMPVIDTSSLPLVNTIERGTLLNGAPDKYIPTDKSLVDVVVAV